MNNFLDIIKATAVTVGGFIGGIMGGLDGVLYALLIFVVLDYITGIMVAIAKKQLSSEIGFKGIFKKILIFILVAVANLIDHYVIGNGEVVRTATIFFYIANEGLSILENAGNLGLPLPKKLKDILLQIQEDEEPKAEISE